MKALLIGLTTFGTSLAALACPTYNGTYTCSGEGMEQEFVLKTEIVDGKYQYSMGESTVIADGVTRPVNFLGGVYDMNATCEAEKVTIKALLPGGEGDNEECGAEKWNMLYTLNFVANGANITESHSLAIQCASGKSIPSDSQGSMECIKK